MMKYPRQNLPSYLMTKIGKDIHDFWKLDNKQHRRITLQRKEINKVSPAISSTYFLHSLQIRVQWGGNKWSLVVPPNWRSRVWSWERSSWLGFAWQDAKEEGTVQAKSSKNIERVPSSLWVSIELYTCGRKLLKGKKEKLEKNRQKKKKNTMPTKSCE